MVNHNDDFRNRVIVRSNDLPWVESPMPGVTRRMLDRVGGELARATSIVRYAPGSHFSPHVHTGGEEFLVLDGVFSDEHGDFPAGSYQRNPPTTSHTPESEPGCTIFVKLFQFDPADRKSVHLRSTGASAEGGVEWQELHRDVRERVATVTLEAHAEVELPVTGGLELLVLEGSIVQSADRLRELDWLRLPVPDEGTTTVVRAGSAGAKFWLKHGHLQHLDADLAMLDAAQLARSVASSDT